MLGWRCRGWLCWLFKDSDRLLDLVALLACLCSLGSILHDFLKINFFIVWVIRVHIYELVVLIIAVIIIVICNCNCFDRLLCRYFLCCGDRRLDVIFLIAIIVIVIFIFIAIFFIFFVFFFLVSIKIFIEIFNVFVAFIFFVRVIIVRYYRFALRCGSTLIFVLLCPLLAFTWSFFAFGNYFLSDSFTFNC